jgi:signal peptidase II
MNRKLPYLFLAFTVVVLDQWTKWLVEVHLPRGVAQPVIDGFLNLVHVKNTGVAFGLFASPGGSTSWALTLMGLVALTAVALYFRFTPHHDRLLLTALGLVAGGAVGNLLDRVMAGSVTDFVDVYVGSYHWPAFNVADSAITVGITLMVLDVFRRRHPEGAEAGRTAAEAG